MLDNLRSNSEANLVPPEEESQVNAPPVMIKSRPRRSFDQVTGTTAVQRLVLAGLFLITICLIGFLLLIFTGKMDPYFLF